MTKVIFFLVQTYQSFKFVIKFVYSRTLISLYFDFIESRLFYSIDIDFVEMIREKCVEIRWHVSSVN